MNCCATCKWWQRDDEPDDQSRNGPDLDELSRLNRTPEEDRIYNLDEESAYYDYLKSLPVRFCKSPKLGFYRLPQAGEAALLDGSGYRAEMITHADFGCVNHEAP